jgi:hypothetical protein
MSFLFFYNQIFLLQVLNPDYVTPCNFIMPTLLLFAEGNPDKPKIEKESRHPVAKPSEKSTP